ncbi:hypothetical protein DYBT9623_00495 [Dyadobacter sp. CECT 9623]|uniref:Transposase n=1 Tax=Dyadobacter linearis TaxID=2823330 RepID=A0ABM8UK19_9BACT|nr:hypothetical protein DYBT9623_00495 [Dyadobacter sp. CECT 9623]
MEIKFPQFAILEDYKFALGKRQKSHPDLELEVAVLY